MKTRAIASLFALGCAAALFAGCDSGGGQYASCDRTTDCSAEYICSAKGCDFPNMTSEGSPCFTTQECATGLYCAPAPGASSVSGVTSGLCVKALVGDGEGLVGASCATDANCKPGLRCDFVGLGGSCVEPGPKGGKPSERGEMCTKQVDCAAGLFCAADNTCASYAKAFTPFAGVECAPDESPFRVFFEIPRPGMPPKDFFRLPFPNDIRVRENGTIDLSDFPRPGASPLGVDIVSLYADTWQSDFDGFSPAAGVIFRFSKEVNFDTLEVHIYDITDPDNYMELGSAWNYTTGRTKYNCQQRLHALSNPDAPLQPGHKYAFTVAPKAPATQVQSKDGEVLQTEGDFSALIGATRPSDAVLGRAWDQYANLRAVLLKVYPGKSLDQIVAFIQAATVFTVQDVPAHMKQLAVDFETQPAPVLKEMVVCDSGVTSPCEDDTGDRSCGVADPDFYEIHGKFTLPNYQSGEAPFLAPENGGSIIIQNSKPVLAGTQDVCFALSIPKKGTMPATGWPLMVYGHGTGGSMRSFLEPTIKSDTAANESIAKKFATASTPMAVFGFDANMHGARRGASTLSPDVLFFNVLNPRAARDNVLQSAVDVLSALRVSTVTVPANLSPTATDISFDPTRTLYWGHSQGAVSGQIALSQSDLSPAVMFSGAGARTIESLLTKQKPFNTKGGIEFLIGDTVDEFHPVMVLFQSFFDRADPIHHNPLFLRRVPSGLHPKHIYMAFGPGDTYVSETSQTRSAGSLGIGWVQTADDPNFGKNYEKANRPVKENINTYDGDGITLLKRTAALFRYKTDGCTDGHFVADCRTEAVADWLSFVMTYLDTGTPTVP